MSIAFSSFLHSFLEFSAAPVTAPLICHAKRSSAGISFQIARGIFVAVQFNCIPHGNNRAANDHKQKQNTDHIFHIVTLRSAAGRRWC
jgi:hypothetical protein